VTTYTPRSAMDALRPLRRVTAGGMYGGRARYVPNVEPASDGWPVSDHKVVRVETWSTRIADSEVDAIEAALAGLPGVIEHGGVRLGDPALEDERPHAWALLEGNGSECYHRVERWTRRL